ncbi:hypothetical protein F5Y06DRAFT_283583 [Hypoxylon sp. FL0890]|nr:hypothetical protein F5Y06DRAFT_283583 [Hypoxylon sp. FL0890]
MKFITMAHPAQSGSKELRRQAHSHAARVAHARSRRLQVANYMEQKARHPVMQEQARQASNRAMGEQDQASTGRDETTTVVPRTMSGAFEREPLAIFLTSLTDREHFLFSHYVTVVLPYLYYHCPVMQHFAEYNSYMRKNWLRFSSTDVDLLRGFLLAACRHLSMVHPGGRIRERRYSVQAGICSKPS